MPPDNPVLVEVVRGDFLESRHRGAVAVVDARGGTVFEAGSVDVPVYPRSSLKPLQALALIETGALAKFNLDGSHVCLACASHNGEVEHTRRVAEWLEKISLSAADLECGTHPPYSEEARCDLARAGAGITPLHNNCSGKHAGFLTVTRHLGIDHHGYIEPDHPLQQMITDTVEETCGYPIRNAAPGVDGCGIPVYGIPLRRLATGFAGFAPSARGSGARAKARSTIVESIVENPYLIAGGGQFCTRVIAASGRRAIIKTGAEGVATGVLLEEGLGIALKIDDGATRAAEVLAAAMLARFSRDPEFKSVLDNEVRVPTRNAAGRDVGSVRASSIATL